MRKIMLLVLILASMLLIVSCRPEIGPGRAIELPSQNYDLSMYPFNIAGPDFWGWSNPLPVYLYANSNKYSSEGALIAAQVEADFCIDTPVGQQCDYAFSPVFVAQPTAKFIAIGTCSDLHIQGLLASDTCSELVQGKAVIQYVDNNKLVVAGGTEDDVRTAVDILVMHKSWGLSGYYSDILNIPSMIAASRIISGTLDYKAVFYFEQGLNLLVNPLDLPVMKQSLPNFFTAEHIGKISRVFQYDNAAGEYTKVYNANAPGNLDTIAERNKVYIIEASQNFMITAEGSIPASVQLGSAYKMPVSAEKLVNAFVTGASVSSITGMSVAGYACSDDMTCWDSDAPSQTDSRNSKNYGVKGTVSGFAYGNSFSYTDDCIDSSRLREWSCSDSCAAVSEIYTCQPGYECSNGACVQSAATPAPSTVSVDFTISKTSVYDSANRKVDYTITVANVGDSVTESGLINIMDYYPVNEIESIISITPEPSLSQKDSMVWVFEKFENTGSSDYTVSTGSIGVMKQYSSKGVFTISISAFLKPDLKDGREIKNTAEVKTKSFSKIAVDEFVVKAPQTITRPVYRCWGQSSVVVWDKLGLTKVVDIQVMNHYLSFNSNCEGNTVDGLIGHVYKEQQQGTIALYQCYRSTSYHNNNVKDNFATTDSNCEGHEGRQLLGYIPSSQSGLTKAIYRCWNEPDDIKNGKFDHMVSESPACEGYKNEGITFYFLNEPVIIQPVPDAPKISAPGESCAQTIDCQFGYECISGVCTRKVLLYSCDGAFFDTSSNCGILGWEYSVQDIIAIGYVLDSSIQTVPGTILLGVCTNPETGQYTFGRQRYPNVIPCSGGYGFNVLGYVFTLPEEGTVPLLTLEEGTLGYIYPKPYCGDGILQSGEECEADTDCLPGETCVDCVCVQPVIIPPTIGIPVLVPPPAIPPAVPPFPHQFYGLVVNGTAGMQIRAELGGTNFNTAADTNIQYGYSPLFFVTGTTNGAPVSFYLNTVFNQAFPFQQGALTRLDLVYSPVVIPPVGPTCSDGVQNQDETDIDCGGTVCPKCSLDRACLVHADCLSNYCLNNACKIRPVTTTTVTVGGGGGGGRGQYTPAEQFYGTPQSLAVPSGTDCFDDWICDEWGPCIDGMQARECFLNDYPECLLQLPKPETSQACIMPEPVYVPPAVPNCFDGIQNQDETYIDCGGSICKPCDPNLPCIMDRDCVTNYCEPMTRLCRWPPVIEVPKPVSRSWIWAVIAIIAIIGVVGLITAMLLKRKPEVPPNHRLDDLKNYIDTFKKKGVSEDKIKKKVLESGWKKEVVDKVLK